MKKHESLSSAKAIVGLLILAVVAVVFYKFVTYQNYFSDDPEALRNYVTFAIIGGGFLIGLLYLTSQTTHKQSKAISKSVRSSKATKRKKK